MNNKQKTQTLKDKQHGAHINQKTNKQQTMDNRQKPKHTASNNKQTTNTHTQ